MVELPMLDPSQEDVTEAAGESEGKSSQGSVSSQQDEDERSHMASICYMKALIFLLVGSLALVGTVLSSILLRNDAKENYETQFFEHALAIDHFSNRMVVDAVQSLRTLSHSITSSAIEQKSTFPTVEIQHFKVLGEDARLSALADFVFFAPMVYEQERHAWESFALNHQSSGDFEGLATTGERLGNISSEIHPLDENSGRNHYAPIWQIAPSPADEIIVNWDIETIPHLNASVLDVIQSSRGALGNMHIDSDIWRYIVPDLDASMAGYIVEPVFNTFDTNATLVAFLVAVFRWENYLKNLLPQGVRGIEVVIRDSQASAMTYQLHGSHAEQIGESDVHNPTYDNLNYRATLGNASSPYSLDEESVLAGYTMVIYPTSLYEEDQFPSTWVYLTLVIVTISAVAIVLFYLYDRMVTRLLIKLSDSARKATTLVASLFPASVQRRILENVEEEEGENVPSERGGLRMQIGEETKSSNVDFFKTKPIADVFPNTSIMFADIVGFTAWSSAREPSQVFVLLESIYHAFDELATKKGIFKVETVGDCYVAAAGLPEPRGDHAQGLVRFARGCMTMFHEIVRDMDEKLGPDTSSLGLRIGIHSGPVTAGVLRGSRSRFQLFGDTVNTTSRMETTSEPNRIHLSLQTAELLIAAGKEEWISKREEKVFAKGKGELQTYWLRLGEEHSAGGDADQLRASSEHSLSRTASIRMLTRDRGLSRSSSMKMISRRSNLSVTQHSNANDKAKRLITWMTEILSSPLKELVARRSGAGNLDQASVEALEGEVLKDLQGGKISLDELSDALYVHRPNGDLPECAPPASMHQGMAELSSKASAQLHDYVQMIAKSYQDHPFHNFEHAGHVVMSVQKLLSRLQCQESDHETEDTTTRTVMDHSFGLAHDPLTQFAALFAALIHDVDHPGVPNSVLVAERTVLATAYKGQSIAEQNSLDLAWELLMQPRFRDLRQAIYSTQEEFKRFRQVLVNCVLATDIMNSDVKGSRLARWEKVFGEGALGGHDPDGGETERPDGEAVRALLVLETLLQASDLSHTMQHWQVFCKWNERLFRELHQSYQDGRLPNDPSKNWYENEMAFFDRVVLPLARDLESCGAFGVSSHEYLTYAVNNRRDWEENGRQVVGRYMDSIKSPHDSGIPQDSFSWM